MGQLGKYEQLLAPGDGRIVGWIEAAGLGARECRVAVCASEVVEKSVGPDIDLIEIERAELFGGVIADIARFEHRSLDLALESDTPLLHVGYSQIGIGQPQRAGCT